MLLTYPYFFVDISSVLYEQPYNISGTIAYHLRNIRFGKKMDKLLLKQQN